MINLILEYLLLNLPEGMLITFIMMCGIENNFLKNKKFWVSSILISMEGFLVPYLIGGLISPSLIILINYIIMMIIIIKILKYNLSRIFFKFTFTFVIIGIIEMSVCTYIWNNHKIILMNNSYKYMLFSILKTTEFLVLTQTIGGGIVKLMSALKAWLIGNPEERKFK